MNLNAWTNTFPMPNNIGYMGVATDGQRIFCSGGMSGSNYNNSTYLSSTGIYNIISGVWQDGPELPTNRYGHASVYLNGKVYINQGYVRTGGSYTYGKFLIWDVEAHTIREAASLDSVPAILPYYNLVAVGNSLYTHTTSGVHKYSIERDEWEIISSEFRQYSASIAVGSKIYYSDGTRTITVFDTATNSWLDNETIKVPFNRGFATPVVPIGNTLYLLGQDYTYSYNLDTGVWHIWSEGLGSLTYFGFAVAENNIYALGGLADNNLWVNRVSVFSTGEDSSQAYHSITESHFDQANGTYIFRENYVAIEVNNNYSNVAPQLVGYKRTGHKIDNGTVSALRTATIPNVNGNHFVTFFYEPCSGGNCIDPDDYKIAQNYYDQTSGIFILPETYKYVEPDGTYINTAPIIPGYRRTAHRVDGVDLPGITATIPNVQDNHVVTFLYEEGEEPPEPVDTFTITQHYQLQDGTPVQSSDSTTVTAGDNYTKTAPVLPGYRRTTHRVDGAYHPGFTATIPNVQADHLVTFLYEEGEEPPEPGDGFTITQHYRAEDGMQLLVSDTTTVAAGETYTKTAPGVTGYTCIGYRIDGGVLQSGSTASILDVQADHQVLFVYRENGDTPGPGPGGGSGCCKIEVKITACCGCEDILGQLSGLLQSCNSCGCTCESNNSCC